MQTEDQDPVAPARDTKPPRRGRHQGSLRAAMLRSCLWTLLLVAVLTGVIGAGFGLALGRQIAVPDWMRDRIETRIAAALPGVELRFAALTVFVDTGWLPQIRLQDVTLREAGAAEVLRIDEIEAQMSGPALLRGQVDPVRLRLSGSSLALRRNLDGRYDLAFGFSFPVMEQAPSLPELLARIDRVLTHPRFAALRAIEADQLGLRYEDARTQRSWQVDSGRILLRRDGDALSLRGNVALLSGEQTGEQSGGQGVSTLSMNYEGRIGTPQAQIGLSFDDMPAADLASQSGALAWLGVLRAPISGATRVSVDPQGRLGPLSVALQIGAGAVQPNDQAQPIPFDSARAYMTYTPETRVLQFDELSVDSKWITGRAEGRAVIETLVDGRPVSMLGQFRLSDIVADPADLYDTPVQLEEAQMDLRLRLDPFALTLGQLTLFDRGQRLLLDGKIGVTAQGWDLAVNGSMDAVLPQRILELWPERLVPGTRSWIATNLHSARLQDVQLGYRRAPDGTDKLHLAFAFDGANATYARAMPVLTAAAGQASLTDQRFVISATKGTVTPAAGGALDMAGTSFIIRDVAARPAPAQIRLASTGSLTATLAMLDSPNLRFLEKAGRTPDIATGQAEVTAVIDMPLQPQLSPDELRYAASARLRDVVSADLLPGRVLRADAMELRATPQSLRIGGSGRLGSVPFTANWTTALRDNTDGASRVDGTVTLSQTLADEFGLALPAGTFSGSAPGQIVVELARDRPATFRLTSDLVGLGLSVAPLGWSKPQRTAGQLEVAGALGSPVSVDRIALNAPGLDLSGALNLTPAGQLATASFDRIRVGNWLDAPVTLTGRGAGVAPAIAMTGGRVDLRQMNLGGAGQGASGQGGSGQGATPLQLSLDQLIITDTIALHGFRGSFPNASQLDGTFTARVNDQAPIRGRVMPMNGRSALRIQADDAGDVLVAARLLPQARDGALDLTLLPASVPGSYNGALKITDFRVRDAPAIAALVNAVSVVGLLEQLNGQGLHFSDVDARFVLTPNQLVVQQASAIGASIGVSLDGYYDLASNVMDFQGVFSPVYLINGIGAALTRRGEGVFGVTYTLRGPANAPQVQVNPLSAFAPGMLREIFRRPSPSSRRQ